MSLFRKPKKIQRRVFCSYDDEDEQENARSDKPVKADEANEVLAQERKERSKKSSKTQSDANDSDKYKSKSLLSFADDVEESDEIFQVRKSSQSKKLMRMQDKERRKRRRDGRPEYETENGNGDCNATATNVGSSGGGRPRSDSHDGGVFSKSNKSENIQTEIRTDDFVLVVKKSELEPQPAVVLNGRAALCAGRDDMSDDEEGENDEVHEQRPGSHRYTKPEQLRKVLESGSIPDAAMIHAARKRRQLAREQGDFIPIEENKEPVKSSTKLARDDMEGDQSDDEERMDMNDITGKKEREERREQFLAAEHDSSNEDSDNEMHEWEKQQLRKGVTSAQLAGAQSEAVLSRFLIKPTAVAIEAAPQQQSTSILLEQAYAKNAMQKSHNVLAAKALKSRLEKSKSAALRTPEEIRAALAERLASIKELNAKHVSSMTRIGEELSKLKLEQAECRQKAPAAAAKYRNYQELKCYVHDIVECLNEKLPTIEALEKRHQQLLSKQLIFLIDRRRSDMQDQARELAEASKQVATMRRGPDVEEQTRRAAEREGRRTRRRCERERKETAVTHLDGMSSDDETPDQYQEQQRNLLQQIKQEALEVFNDVNEEFCRLEHVLLKFHAWRADDMASYKSAFVHLCLPKIIGAIVRLEMLCWYPLAEDCVDIETMNWYAVCMQYAFEAEETLEQLKDDPDSALVPKIVEKIVLPKLTEIIKGSWDPLSTTQTLRLINFVHRLGRDYPLKSSGKHIRAMFEALLVRMKSALDNDVYIPIFPKQNHDAKSSFFQRQFCSGLKLFRNILSWQGIIADNALQELAINSLLNRYFLMAMRHCSPADAINKAYIIVNTLPTVWLTPDSATIKRLAQFVAYIRHTLESFDAGNLIFLPHSEKAKQILQRLHSS